MTRLKRLVKICVCTPNARAWLCAAAVVGCTRRAGAADGQAVAAVLATQADTRGQQVPQPGVVAPPFTLRVINQERAQLRYLSLEAHVGLDALTPKSAVLAAFVSQDCKSCAQLMKHLAAFGAAFKQAHVLPVAIGVNTDSAKVQTFAEQAQKFDFPVLCDRFALVHDRFGKPAVPALFVLDAQGRVAYSAVGDPMPSPTVLLGHMRQMLGQPIDAPVPSAVAALVEKNKPQPAAAKRGVRHKRSVKRGQAAASTAAGRRAQKTARARRKKTAQRLHTRRGRQAKP